MMPKTKTPSAKKTSKPSHPEFSYRNYEHLASFTSERARIQGRKRTSLSAKDQRKLAKAVKHARHLGLLPYKARV